VIHVAGEGEEHLVHAFHFGVLVGEDAILVSEGTVGSGELAHDFVSHFRGHGGDFLCDRGNMGFQSSETVVKVSTLGLALLFHFGKSGGQYAFCNSANGSGASLCGGEGSSLPGGSTGVGGLVGWQIGEGGDIE
jgi:hypothetical protein